MTREEAIQKWVIPAIKNMWNEKICDEVIKSLEQEPILDKIRAEIEQLPIYGHITDGITCYGTEIISADKFRDRALQIIDKYREVGE